MGDLDKNRFIDERSKALLEGEPEVNGTVDMGIASINSFKVVWFKKERNGAVARGKENHLFLKNEEITLFMWVNMIF